MAIAKNILRDIEAIQHDLGTLAKTLENPAVVTRLSHTLEESKDAVGEKLAALSEKVEDLVGKGKDVFSDTQKKMRHTVKEYPMTSVLAALGVGILLGKLLDLRE